MKWTPPHDHFGIGARRFPRECETVAEEIATQWKISGVM